MPDIEFASIDVVPEGLREYAETKNGKVVVDVGPNKKIKEFRDNNIAISQERDAKNTRLTSYVTHLGYDDPEKFATELADLRSVKQQVVDGTLKGTEAIQKAIQTGVAAKEASMQGTIQALTQERDTNAAAANDWKSKFQRSTLRQEITNVVLHKDSGAEPTALPDILARAEQIFAVLDNGRLEARNGDQVIYSKKDGSSPMSPMEWLAETLATAPHLQKQSSGAGGTGGRGGQDQYFGMSKEAFMKLSPTERINKEREHKARS